MTDVFTSAGLRRIAVACGASDEDVATGDPAGALVRRWLQAPTDPWFEQVRTIQDLLQLDLDLPSDEHWDGVWLGFEDVGPLPFIRFAGFVEVGVRCGYLDLNYLSAWPELRDAIDRWTFIKHNPVLSERLANALFSRLAEADGHRLSEPRNAASIAAFESYMRLDETVRRDLDLQEFLAVCHRQETKLFARDLFLAAPEFFAEALSTRRFVRLSVGGQVLGGLQAAKAMERLWQLLANLGQQEDLREAFILHPRWAHQSDKVFKRLQMWAFCAEQWNAIAGTEKDPGLGWALYQERTLIPLIEQQRSRLMLADSSWAPILLSDAGVFFEPKDSAGHEVEYAREAEAEGFIDTALSIYARTAQRMAEHIDQNDSTQVDFYWDLIKNLLRLGDQETAAALSSVAYEALLKQISLEEEETLKGLREFLLRARGPARQVRDSDRPEAEIIQQPAGIERVPGQTQTRQTEAISSAASSAAVQRAIKL